MGALLKSFFFRMSRRGSYAGPSLDGFTLSGSAEDLAEFYRFAEAEPNNPAIHRCDDHCGAGTVGKYSVLFIILN